VIDREGLEQRLALAREGFSPSVAAKARVRAGLSPVKPRLARLNGSAKAVGVAKPVVGLIAALAFAAGFWLGRSEPTEPRGDASTASAQPGSMRERSAWASEHPNVPSAPAASEQAMDDARVAPASPTAESSSRGVHAPPEATRSQTPPSHTARSLALSPKPSANAGATGSGVSPRALKDELSLLKRVERAIRANEAALALSFLDELDRRHPHSALREERTAARIIAECMLSLPAAGPRAAHFLDAHRDSVYVDRVRRACEAKDASARETR
jgi:hypothetical protein